MPAYVKSITYPASSDFAVTMQVVDDETVPDIASTASSPNGVARGVTILGRSGNHGEDISIWRNGAYSGSFAQSGTLSGKGSFADPLVFTFHPSAGWAPGVSKISAYVRGTELALRTTNDRKPLSIAAAKRVRYYPRNGEPNHGTGGGLLVSISDTTHWPSLSLTNGAQTNLATRATRYGVGAEGTWEPLDFRDRRHFRLHGTHIPFLLDEFEADPTLFDFWLSKGINWHETPIDCIMQGEVNLNSPPGLPALISSWVHGSVYGSLMDSNFTRAAALGIPMNYGVLTVAIMQQQSQWWSHDWWQFQADSLNHFLNRPAIRDNMDNWLHLQMETVGAVFQVTDAILAANGITRAQLKAAMQPFLDAITASGLRAISRPMGGNSLDGTNDVAFPLIQAAAADGSIYCSEFQTTDSHGFRRNEYSAYQRLGGGNDNNSKPARWRLYDRDMPQFGKSHHVQLRSGGEFRMSGDVIRENPFELDAYYPVVELVDLIDGWTSGVDPAPPHPLRLGARPWYYMEKAANVGTARTSANDAQCVWTVTGDPTGTTLDIKAKRCLGKGRGTARQLRIAPWRRAISGGVDAELSPSAQTLVPGFVCKYPAANDARCWRIPGTIWADPVSLVNTTSFTFAMSFRTASLPASGNFYGIAGNTQTNSGVGAWAILLNGTSGALELQTIKTGGIDTFTILASPAIGADIRVVIGYDLAQGKWLTHATGGTAVYTAPASGKIRDPSGLAILLGGSNDVINRGTTIYGFPEGVLLFDTEIMFWDRALTTAEAVSVVEHRWPYNYDLF